MTFAVQIIAMGGGGFSMEADNPLLDLYILDQARTAHPGICFIPPWPSRDYILRFYRAFSKHHCRPTDLSLFDPPKQGLEQFIKAQDIIYPDTST